MVKKQKTTIYTFQSTVLVFVRQFCQQIKKQSSCPAENANRRQTIPKGRLPPVF